MTDAGPTDDADAEPASAEVTMNAAHVTFEDLFELAGVPSGSSISALDWTENGVLIEYDPPESDGGGSDA